MVESKMRSRTMSFGAGNDTSVKLEIAAAEEVEAEEGHGRLSKRSRLSPSTSSSPPFIQWSTANNDFTATPLQYNPLNEPSPLGLRLRKSPSLLDLIQMRLSQNNASPVAAQSGSSTSTANKDAKNTAASIATDKMKASNFAASVIRIGRWEFVARHEGDLVAKCYFAKHKLVWEVLEAGLKSKIEIQWSDIMALKASFPDNGPSTLTIVLARQPLFFRETNPQPRKHTLWQAASDFTDGQASIHRQHILQCPPGALNKHFEKLIQCDTRLNMLSQQPEIVMDKPYFDTQASAVESPDEFKSSQLRTGEGSSVSSFPDVASPSISDLSSLNFDTWDSATTGSAKEAPSPSSVMDANAIEGNGNYYLSDSQGLKNLKVPGLHPSMSMTDLVSHIGQHISEQVTSGSIPSEKASECQNIFENIAQIMLSDTQNVAASDEKLMKKVNSLCCLLQDPTVASSAHVEGENYSEGPLAGRDAELNYPSDFMFEMKAHDDVVSSVDPKQTPGIPRRDSLGDLLLNLPRIASFPKFLFNIAEADESKYR
ncbi:uncharacterized protein [Coffea arabica]|uniref:TRF2/HOY1 PH-like domain-containing protein n=1 Tax=Coffea arabica TaxID=13443 RepID=A0A6P6T4R3_COFAR|nr:uncharacterized protein LOC113697529 [Coffea arabica]